MGSNGPPCPVRLSGSNVFNIICSPGVTHLQRRASRSSNWDVHSAKSAPANATAGKSAVPSPRNTSPRAASHHTISPLALLAHLGRSPSNSSLHHPAAFHPWPRDQLVSSAEDVARCIGQQPKTEACAADRPPRPCANLGCGCYRAKLCHPTTTTALSTDAPFRPSQVRPPLAASRAAIAASTGRRTTANTCAPKRD